MAIVRYEFAKLLKKKLFLSMTVLLLVANLLTIYTYEKHTNTFFYVHEQKESYTEYVSGEMDADIDGHYQRDMEQQETYIAAYPAFVEEMEQRVIQMESVSIFADREGYVYRNLLKTNQDFAAFQDVALKTDNCFGIRALAGYNNGILFLLVFLALIAYYVLFYERDMNLLLLLKGNKSGHTPLALAKLVTMLIMSALYTFVMECSGFLIYGYLYGYGDMTRAIQSVSLFRNCSYMMTVGEVIAVVLVIRIIIAGVLACFLFLFGMLVKSEGAAVLYVGLVLGIEYLFSSLLSISGSLNGLKTINPFYCWNMEAVLGEYYNLNICGYPINKNVIAILVSMLVVIGTSVFGILLFNKTCQTKQESRLELLFQWLRGKWSFLNRHTSLLYYEFYKIMIQQKKGIVLIVLFLWGISEMLGASKQEYYATAREASYHYYLNQLEGPVTEDTYRFMEQEEQLIAKLWQEMLQLSTSEEDSAYLRLLVVRAELERKEDGFYLVQEQLQKLEEKSGDIYGKYMVDELAYSELWSDTATDVMLWFVGCMVCIYLISGIYPMDEKKQMMTLLKSTYHGRRVLVNSKRKCAILCAFLVFVMIQLPILQQYYRIDGFATLGQSICDFTMIDFEKALPLGILLVLLFSMRLVSFLIVGLLVLKMSRIVKKEPVILCVGIGLIGIIAVICYHFRWSFALLLMQLL